jgi:hypothetical protein
MSSDVIERINILAKASQAGMHFTIMQNELHDDNEDYESDSDADSDTDSEYNSDDASSDGDNDADDEYDDLIAGVDTENTGSSNPDTEEADENKNNNDGLSSGQGDDEALDDVSLSEEDVNKDVPTSLKKFSDNTGELPPIIKSMTRQQARETGKSLMTGAEAIKTVTNNSRNSGRNYRSVCSRERQKKTRKRSETN